jgi:hypothetical protein
MLRAWKVASFAGLIPVIIACSLFQSAPGSTPEVPTAAPQDTGGQTAAAATATAEQGGSSGTLVSFPGGSLVIPTDLASGATVEQVAAVQPDESQPWWNVAPAHIKVTLQGYALQGKFHEPQMVIYPAEEYSANNESVASNLNDLRALIANPAGAAAPGAMPGVPFFNAGAVLSAKTAPVTFPNGQGIRAVTQYSQFYAQVNNAELFYLFHGLTVDGKSYVLVILPVTAPLLAPDGAEASSPPPGGVPFPGFGNIDETLFQTYYHATTDLLNATPDEQFQPPLGTLDSLIQFLELTQ